MSLNHPAKLTTLSHGGGCGCKISPALLSRLLKDIPQIECADLLTGNQTNDDAAVYRISEDQAMVATTDFFPPMVNDPFDFGRIAAANAISDVYAMGARPALALNLLGMPTNALDEAHIKAILMGGQSVCQQAQCVIAGGHSLDSPEPFYGLAVIGFAKPQQILYNATAQSGDLLVLSKPLGIGILSAAVKQNRISEEAYGEMIRICTQLNSVGMEIAQIQGVHAMSDVTGFGLLGHLLEMCHPQNLHAHLRLQDIPFIPHALQLAEQGVTTGAAQRNAKSVAAQVTLPQSDAVREALLTDPQTNGGLLIACGRDSLAEVLAVLQQQHRQAVAIGSLESSSSSQAMISVL